MNKDALADSTRQRILNESRKLGISHELLTRRYVFERFLARLAHSALRDRLVLKGAMALVAVTKSFGRATRDMDMLGLDRLTAAQAGCYPHYRYNGSGRRRCDLVRPDVVLRCRDQPGPRGARTSDFGRRQNWFDAGSA